MKFRKLISEENNFSYIIANTEDVEFLNPINFYMEFFIKQRVFRLNELIKKDYSKYGITEGEAMDYLTMDSVYEWKEFYNSIIKSKVPDNFIELLESKSKKEQVKLLKGQVLNTFTLSAFIFNAWLKYKYTFSQYRSEHYSKGIEKKSLPTLIHVDENDNVEKIGDTKYSNGKLKQIIEHRKVIVAKVLDKENSWHCFITTYNNLSGKETWKEGTSHYHYLSDKWGISRQELINRIKSGNYPSTSVHIDIETHRNS